MNILTKQINARCTAHSLFNALEKLLGKAPAWTPDDLWYRAQEKYGADLVNEKTGTQLWRMLRTVAGIEHDLVIPWFSKSDFSEDDLNDIVRERATAVMGFSRHAHAVIRAKKHPIFGWWQIRLEDSNGTKPRWRALWRCTMVKHEVAVIRKRG